MLDLLLGIFFPTPQNFCPSCPKCQRHKTQRRSIFEPPSTVARPTPPPCIYIPSDRGGCETFEPDIGFRSFFIDSFRAGVFPAPGSVVICDLRLPVLPGVEHSGIADESGLIIHRDGDGFLARVLPSTFIGRLNGMNSALTIYVACKGRSALGNEEALERAEKALKDPEHNRGYDLFRKNCHQFVQYCYTGRTDNEFTFSALERELCQYHDMDNWRRWDINPFEN